MRVLQVIDSLRIGGAQRLLLTFAGQARLHHVEVTIVSLSEFSGGMTLALQLRDLGAEVVVFPASNLFTFSRFWKFLRFVRKGNFSVIHSHLTYANILAGIAGKLLGIPVISTLHSTAVDRRHAHFIRDRIEHAVLRLAQRVIAVGQKVADANQELLKREVVVLPNGVDENPGLSVEERNKLRKDLTGSVTKKILISIGRLSPDKAFNDLLFAFKTIYQQYPETALVVVGSGDLKTELEQQTISLGLNNDVFWLGARNDVSRLLAASDLYVSSSLREGLSVSLLEAMMAGLPLVVTDVGEARLLVQDDAGILVPPAAPDKLAEAVLELLKRDDLGGTLGQAGLKRVREKYGAKQWFMRLIEIYDAVRFVAREQVDVQH